MVRVVYKNNKRLHSACRRHDILVTPHCAPLRYADVGYSGRQQNKRIEDTLLFFPQIRSRNRTLILRHRLRRSLEDDVATHRAAAGTELDEPVAGLQHLDVVLDEEDGVSGIYHGVEEAQDALDVARVETIGGLVHDEDLARIAQIGGQLDALQLAAGEGGERLVQMQIPQADLAQRFQLLGNHTFGKQLGGFVGGEVHHLGDVEAVHLVGEDFRRVAESAAGLAGGLDGIHEGHVVDDDALALTDGTAALAVEGEEVGLGLVGLGEELADVVGDVQIGGRGAAQADADALLANIDDVFGMRIGVAETFHQRTLARARHARDAAHHAQRQLDGNILQVVQMGVLQQEEILGRAHLLLDGTRRAQHRARKRLTVQQFLVGAFKDDFAALHTGAGTHIDDVVGDFDDILVMLHEDDRIAVVFELLHRFLHQQDIVVVEAHTGLVEDVHHVG